MTGLRTQGATPARDDRRNRQDVPVLAATRDSDQEPLSLFEAIVETVPEPLVVLDGLLRVRLANRAFERAFASVSEALEGRPLAEVSAGRWDSPELPRLLLEVLPQRRVVEGVQLSVDVPGSGERELVLNARRLDFGGEELILLAIADVTERVRLHDELERLVAERTAELEAFSYSVSHDLRAPLRALDGFSRALLEDYGEELPPEGRRFLGLIRDNAGQMGALIDGLLAFSRLGRQGLAPRPVEPGALVEEVVTGQRDEIDRRGVRVDVGELGEAVADPVLLRQVFANLIANALKYTRNVAAPRIEIGSTRRDGDRILFVRDNGVGFDMRYAGKVFDVFQRLHRSEEYEGTGIGLALVRRIVERHGGRIWVEAAENHGATFYFTLGRASA